MLIVAITGMPGAGKSTAAKALENFGMKRVVMGDVIREETKRRGLVADEKNTGEVMKDLRKKYGEGAVAELSLNSIGKAKPELLVVDGIRSLTEIEAFGRAGRVLLLAIHASRERRFSLLKERGRSDDPITNETGTITVSSNSRRSLEKIRHQLRDRRVRSAARRLLLTKSEGGSVSIMLNRQAASVGIVALCNREDESPLGPIYMRLESDHLGKLMDWLTAYEVW